jgi:L-threonylcarbamoyladenylate synthase
MVTVPILAATPEAIAKAGTLLRDGSLVAFPTETVYGLGGNAFDGRAVAGIFATKGRPRFNPLIVHVPDVAAAEQLAILGPAARRLAAEFWPGPLTLVLQRRPECGLSDLVTAGLDTVAIRVPDHPVARAVLMAAGVPVAAPSANRSGHVSATTAAHVAEDFRALLTDQRSATLALILDGGPTAHGVESTVLDASGDEIVMLRPGAVTADVIETVLGAPIERALHGGAKPMSPGQLESHYAPRARVRLEATDVRSGEALLAFGPGAPPTTGPAINLSPSGDLMEAAANLFAALRKLDATGVAGIAVMPVPHQGLGEAINDRLQRAAAGR